MSDEPKRFSREELEVACIDAHMSGRIYHMGGEEAAPGDEHRNMLARAISAVKRHRVHNKKYRPPAPHRRTEQMIETLAKRFASLGNLQRSIAADVWPDGAILECKHCRYAERITSEQAGQYLKVGWPKHCGKTMSCERGAAAPTEEPTDD